MKRAVLGLLVAGALAVGAFFGTGHEVMAGSDWQTINCGWGGGCYVAWSTGYGISTVTIEGFDAQSYQWIEDTQWMVCWSKGGCNRYIYVQADPDILWTEVRVSSNAWVNIYNVQCTGGGGGGGIW